MLGGLPCARSKTVEAAEVGYRRSSSAGPQQPQHTADQLEQRSSRGRIQGLRQPPWGAPSARHAAAAHFGGTIAFHVSFG